MNLTKSLKRALACAGVVALSVSASAQIIGVNYVQDDFETRYGDGQTPVLGHRFLSTTPNEFWESTTGGWDESFYASAAATGRDLFDACKTPLDGSPANWVLGLNTEGQTLTRHFWDVGAGKPWNVDFGTEPVYVDMMVKFVLSEDQPDPPADGAVKALIYANAEGKLVVYSGNGSGEKDFSVLNATVDPNQWYRVTLKWFLWVDAGYFSAFTIQLNGGAPLIGDRGWQEHMDQPGPIFLSTADNPSATDLTAVEFQGTGFIDELVVTNNPHWPPPPPPNWPDPIAYEKWKDKFNITKVTANMLTAYMLGVNPGANPHLVKPIITNIDPIKTGGAIIDVRALDGNGQRVPLDLSPEAKIVLLATPDLKTIPFSPLLSWEYLIMKAGTYVIPTTGAAKYFYKAQVQWDPPPPIYY